MKGHAQLSATNRDFTAFRRSKYDLNAQFWLSPRVNLIVPLIDIINHYQPKSTDDRDVIHFAVEVIQNGEKGERCLTIRTSQYIESVGEEVAYTYNKQLLEPFHLLRHYGFTVDNDPQGKVGMSLSLEGLTPD